jgi:AcrR family transcriptional regulator
MPGQRQKKVMKYIAEQDRKFKDMGGVKIHLSIARVKLLTAAEKLFARQGYAEISTRQIAAAAGLNAALISYYFGSKQALYYEIFETRLAEINLGIEQISWQSGSAKAKLNAFLNTHIERYRLNSHFQRLLFREIAFLSQSPMKALVEKYLQHNMQQLKAIVDEGIASGQFKAVDTSFFSISIMSLVSIITCDPAIAELVTNSDKIRRHKANTENIINYIHRILSVENTLNAKYGINP